MIVDFKNHLNWSMVNAIGKRYSGKYVVIHSDDWGSIRMPSNQVREKLYQLPGISKNSPYDYFDTLASPDDLIALFEVLKGFKDCKGNHPVVTANCVLANPDFEKIKSTNFESYHFEPIKDTFHTYGIEKSFELWEEGIKENIFIPQFHGREHVRIEAWMKALKNNSEIARKAFELGTFAVESHNFKVRKGNFQAAWDFVLPHENLQILNSIEEGLEMFNKQFGFHSKTAIAPSYTWTEDQELLCKSFGVNQMQGILTQKIPNSGDNYTFKKRFQGMDYQMRNAFFEPSIDSKYNALQVIQRARVAFAFNKPLIISAHRLNFIGGLKEENRTKNLLNLQSMLKGLLARFPDIQFLSADQLVEKQ